MDKQAIMNKLAEYIKSSFHISDDDAEFTSDVHLFDYGYIDSFGATELIAFIEETYDIEVTKKDLMLYPLNTVSEISEFIQGKLKE